VTIFDVVVGTWMQFQKGVILAKLDLFCPSGFTEEEIGPRWMMDAAWQHKLT
jgi:hypothetical protein